MKTTDNEIIDLIQESRIKGLKLEERERLAYLLAYGGEKDDENFVNIFYDYLLPEFLKEVKKMLSCYGKNIQMSREKNYLKRLLGAEITKVYNNIVNQKEGEKCNLTE